MKGVPLFASKFVDHPTGRVVDGGVEHIVESVSGPRTLCGRDAKTTHVAPGYASCRSCMKSAGITPPDPITLDEFTALARELGVDMRDWSWATTAEAVDEDGHAA